MALEAVQAGMNVPAADDLDDIESYIQTLDESERSELAAAGAAIDIAILLYRSREHRGLSQTAAAKLAGLQQQAVSRFERPDVQPRLETIQAYLGALGYALELNVIDVETGESAAKAVLPPKLLENRRQRTLQPRRRKPSHRMPASVAAHA